MPPVYVLALAILGGLLLLTLGVYGIRRYLHSRRLRRLGRGPAYGTFTDNKLWVDGDNPTDASNLRHGVYEPVDLDAQAARRQATSKLAQQRLARLASNYCRSSAHARSLVLSLTCIGARPRVKFAALMLDQVLEAQRVARHVPGLPLDMAQRVSAARGRLPFLLLVRASGLAAATGHHPQSRAIRIDRPNVAGQPQAAAGAGVLGTSPQSVVSVGSWSDASTLAGDDVVAERGGRRGSYEVSVAVTALVDFARSKHRRAFKKLLLGLQHPYVLQTLEVGWSVEMGHMFIVRRFSEEGSLRDLIYKAVPEREYNDKYYEKRKKKRAGGRSRKRQERKHGKPLPVAQIGLLGAQVLQGVMYLRRAGLPFYHVHAGNVIVFHGGRVARLTDYDNAFFGERHRMHRLVDRYSPVDVDAEQALSVLVALLLFEMATGRPPSKKNETFLVPLPQYAAVDQVLKRVLTVRERTPLAELLSMPLFQGAARPDMTPLPKESERRTALLEPVAQFHQQLYPEPEAPPMVEEDLYSDSATSLLSSEEDAF